ncbi:glycosyltransferase [Paenibacillus glycinis]|uniref:Glycosyltransferase n=1 Tax=Paenibacillus glycinis TaxID=2697035 RepID=A0ABW9XRF8_9BACL|nr:glycosyltransferase [Paenibacillus glycinis]NBD25234.1 glycosyltransferase [Paenibacillus glycinis]
MRSRFLNASLLGLTLALGAAPLPAGAAGTEHQARQLDHSAAHAPCLSPAAVKLQGDMRRLWLDHVNLTRDYIVSAVAGTPDQEAILARLLQNQQDIGNAVKPFYGEEAGNKLAALLKEHIELAGKILVASKAGDAAEAEKQTKLWYRNGDDIVAFLTKANPKLSAKELHDLFYRHLSMVADALTARLKQDWAGDMTALDKGENHIVILADFLTDGIVKQFPRRFK